MHARRSAGYVATVTGASGGAVIGFVLAVVLSYVSYFVLGGAGCDSASDIDECEDPFLRALLVVGIAVPLFVLGGAAIGSHLALRPTGLSARRLTVTLVPILSVVAVVLLAAAAVALDSGIVTATLWVLSPSLLVLVPLAARFLATRGRSDLAAPPGVADEVGPPRRAW